VIINGGMRRILCQGRTFQSCRKTFLLLASATGFLQCQGLKPESMYASIGATEGRALTRSETSTAFLHLATGSHFPL
jgi:hypothetical protein